MTTDSTYGPAELFTAEGTALGTPELAGDSIFAIITRLIASYGIAQPGRLLTEAIIVLGHSTNPTALRAAYQEHAEAIDGYLSHIDVIGLVEGWVHGRTQEYGSGTPQFIRDLSAINPFAPLMLGGILGVVVHKAASNC